MRVQTNHKTQKKFRKRNIVSPKLIRKKMKVKPKPIKTKRAVKKILKSPKIAAKAKNLQKAKTIASQSKKIEKLPEKGGNMKKRKGVKQVKKVVAEPKIKPTDVSSRRLTTRRNYELSKVKKLDNSTIVAPSSEILTKSSTAVKRKCLKRKIPVETIAAKDLNTKESVQMCDKNSVKNLKEKLIKDNSKKDRIKLGSKVQSISLKTKKTLTPKLAKLAKVIKSESVISKDTKEISSKVPVKRKLVKNEKFKVIKNSCKTHQKDPLNSSLTPRIEPSDTNELSDRKEVSSTSDTPPVKACNPVDDTSKHDATIAKLLKEANESLQEPKKKNVAITTTKKYIKKQHTLKPNKIKPNKIPDGIVLSRKIKQEIMDTPKIPPELKKPFKKRDFVDTQEDGEKEDFEKDIELKKEPESGNDSDDQPLVHQINSKLKDIKPPPVKRDLDSQASIDSVSLKTEPLDSDSAKTSNSSSSGKNDFLTNHKSKKKPRLNHKVKPTSKVVLLKKRILKGIKDKKKSRHTDPGSDSEQRSSRRMKLFGFWSGPKRHRVASLNALAKVHCLYENESRGAFLELLKPKRSRSVEKQTSDSEPPSPPVQRNLRSAPGMRGMGKHWDMHNASSTSSSSTDESVSSPESSNENPSKIIKPPPSYKQKQKTIQRNKEKEKADETAKATNVNTTKKRNRTEIVMDLKDMVVRKRMASLNATAILAASYSPDKRSSKDSSSYDESSDESEEEDSDLDTKTKRRHYDKNDDERKYKSSNKKKVSVIVNQDTDVTITGVYVNSTTRSTHLHEGYCSIAGMQYRISATSHTQTNATAVSTETLQLHSGQNSDQNATSVSSNGSDQQPANVAPMQPCKSYTPLGALSSMQPPGIPPTSSGCGTNSGGSGGGGGGGGSGSGSGGTGSGVVGNNSTVVPPTPSSSLSPLSATGGRSRHGCSSAFSAPPYGPSSHAHHHLLPATKMEHPPPHGYIHGYYQPAGPLISAAHHTHSHVPPHPTGSVLGSTASGKISAPLPSLETTPSSPLSQQPPAPSSAGESSDNDVIITAASTSSGGETPHNPIPQGPAPPPTAAAFRYTSYSAPAGGPPPGYTSYGFPPAQYYPTPQYGPTHPPHFHHQDLCYSTTAPYPPYFHSKTYGAPSGSYHRRYIPAPSSQYYPQEVFSSSQPAQQTSQVVTAVSTTGSAGPGGTFQSPSGPPPPTLVETYQAPPSGPISIVEPYPGPPSHYFTGYTTAPVGPPPGCYSHSPPTRSLSFIDASYQSCPCPMQSCPKNVHTGPLTGDGKRSNMTVIAKESTGLPLPPVALALPLEPASVVGPPSPARGSAGMPPPPSPAGATYQPISTPKQEDANNNCSPAPENKSPGTLGDKVRKKARVGKNMVRNTIASNFKYRQTENTMLLMCHSTEGIVKRETLSPESDSVISSEKERVLDDRFSSNIKMKSAQESLIPQQTVITTVDVTEESPTVLRTTSLEDEDFYKRSPDTTTNEDLTIIDNSATIELDNRLKMPVERQEDEEEPKVESTVIEIPTSDEIVESSEPEVRQQSDNDVLKKNYEFKISQKTAGTKRKFSTHLENNDVTPVQKKRKSSYKDLIRKNPNTIQINNGVRKLNCQMSYNRCLKSSALIRKPKICTIARHHLTTSPRTGFKRKKPPEDFVKKKQKTTKSLIINNNTHTTNNKQKVLTENVVASARTIVADSTIKTVKKTAPALLDSLLSKNTVDRTSATKTENNITDEKSSSKSLEKYFERKPQQAEVETRTPPLPSPNSLLSKPTELTKPTARRRCRNLAKGKSKTKRKTKNVQTVEVVPIAVSKVPRRISVTPRWSNGWSWEGEPYQARVFLNSDDIVVTRTCYPAMRHSEGDIIYPRDCVLLKSGQRKSDLPFVAKISALWENPEDGEMMMSLFWFYRPEHTEQGRLPTDHPDEVFASRHKDTNSVACIEDKCYVLTFFEYCRYYKNVRLLEEDTDDSEQIVPMPEGGIYTRENRLPPRNQPTSPDLIFFCSRVYDFRQKRLVKNPN